MEIRASSAITQLIQYFEISNSLLGDLNNVLSNPKNNWTDVICHDITSKAPDTKLEKRQVQVQEQSFVQDPMLKVKEQLVALESEVNRTQEPIKQKIQDQIKDIQLTVNALKIQALLLECAETGQIERQKQIDSNKVHEKNLKENSKKITKHLQKSKVIDNQQKANQINGLKEYTQSKIQEVENYSNVLKNAIKDTQKFAINPETSRLKEQSQVLKSEIQKLEKQLKLLMLTPVDKKEIYSICLKTTENLQKASGSIAISQKALKVALSVLKCALSIGLTILTGGVTVNLVASSVTQLACTCADIIKDLSDK